MLNYPQINPVILRLTEQLAVSWYSLAYFVGIMYGMHFSIWASRRYSLGFEKKDIEDVFGFGILALIFFGRLGYVLFYGLSHYIEKPIDIIKTWEGGMSFHGGFLGVMIISYIFCRIKKLNYLKILDLAAVSTPLGIMLGRIANFINAELYGRATDSWIGMIFPTDPKFIPRHPSQLYQSFLEGFVLFIIMNLMFFKFKKYNKTGFISSFFCIFYGLFRFIVEFFREPDAQVGYIFKVFSMGQVLSISIVMIGVFIAVRFKIFKNGDKI
jgi:phosphatidylglycerol:prolipoprotein diacylglycerol transferase